MLRFGYNVNGSFFNDPNAPLWHAAIGYEISGIIGILLIGGVAFGLAMLSLQASGHCESCWQALKTQEAVIL